LWALPSLPSWTVKVATVPGATLCTMPVWLVNAMDGSAAVPPIRRSSPQAA